MSTMYPYFILFIFWIDLALLYLNIIMLYFPHLHVLSVLMLLLMYVK